jgi:hypothetical protein
MLGIFNDHEIQSATSMPVQHNMLRKVLRPRQSPACFPRMLGLDSMAEVRRYTSRQDNGEPNIASDFDYPVRCRPIGDWFGTGLLGMAVDSTASTLGCSR